MAEVTHEVVLVPGDEDSGHDTSDLESMASSSTSITASILDYRIENGRTYHRYKDGKYIFPNDARESDRLDQQHEIFIYTLDGKLGLAPPCKPDSKVGRVLDVGTGTGVWAVDFGDLHPEAEILGIDLSAPQQEFVPPNVRFEIDDIEEEWTYSEPFNYIHSRFMNASIANWKEYLKKCYDNVAPGGYLELLENQVDPVSDDNTLPKDSSIHEYVNLILSGSEKMGRVFVDVSALKSLVVEAGFVDIELRIFKWPMNGWPKDEKYKKLGLWCHENFSSALEAVCMALLTRVHGWTRGEVDVFLVNVRKDLKNGSYHAYFPIYSVVGRKPEKEEAAASA
ncbi:S-adenosyl-L-methionine-dependent methyltransferase [Colletotrichum acutatum]|uniref:S-adenosyl-L-methionine-dependent methyltransferase n=1 Tax=Glomerella acutata TaxID=27357 RepID=A0AAD9CZJ3_GLOAC|nr:S-adenosyl-L-methionine-dependent methyltransferase [Colletotrichum acutatum]KAK1729382.1 S-adenosyl-L-methionine-dependent methyltransferase [Colletotrichum acutatum]